MKNKSKKLKDETGKSAKKADQGIDNNKPKKGIFSAKDNLHDLFIQAPGFITILRGPDHIFDFANKKYLQLIGKDETIIGKPVVEVLPEVRGQGFIELLDNVRKTGEPFIGNELPAKLDRNGAGNLEEAFLDFIYEPVKDNNGIVHSIYVQGIEVTEKVKNRKLIAESEQKYRALFEKMDQGFCIVDVILDHNKVPEDYRFLEINPVFELQTGLKNAKGRTAKELIPNLEQRWVDIYGDVALTGKSSRFVEGSEAMGRWFEVYAFKIGEEGGLKVAILFTDITERKKSEEAIRENERRFKLFAEAMPQMAFIADPKGEIIYFNKRWYDFVGGMEGTEGWGWKNKPIHHPDDLDRTIKTWNEALESGNSYEIEYRLRRHDGKYRWHLGKAEPVRDNQGNIEMWLGTNTDIHDHKEIEEALRAQNKLTQTITDNATTSLFIKDESQFCTYMNPAAEKMTGYTLQEILKINKPLHDIIHHTKPDGSHYPQKDCPMDRAFPAKNRTQGEDIFIRPDGTFYPIAFTASPIVRSGKTVGTIMEVRDLTEEKDIINALNKSKNRFRALADNISQLAWMTDETGWIFWYNKRWFDYTGTTLKEMEGWGWQKIYHPDHVERVVNGFQMCIDEGKEWEDIFPLRGKDGKYSWFLSRAVPIKDENGKTLQWFGTNTDITKQREAEELLNYQKSLLEAQQKVSPLGVLVVSPEGKMLTYNEQFIKMWNLPTEITESRDDNLALQISQEQLLEPEKFIERAQEIYRKKEKNHEKLRFKNGQILERFGAPLKGEDDNFYGYAWFFIDITEKEILLRQKDEFIGIASHELKTPVTSIKGYTQILQEQFAEAENQSTSKILSRMDIQLDKLTTLVSDLLDVTKVEQGKLQFRNESFTLNDLILEVADEIRHTSKKHQIIEDLDADVTLLGDRERIGQVITNLLTNAIKYSPKKDKVIIKTLIEQGNNEVKVSVQDFGMGLSVEDQKKVFERFFRVENMGYKSFAGLGLGLFISAEIINRHNGTIGVESKIGEGSIFHFTLPVK
ncbi:MAG: PAS domain-containing sensor histidine kinase [Candidatus Cyclobacteriaceae bacterium M2_1C_046]